MFVFLFVMSYLVMSFGSDLDSRFKQGSWELGVGTSTVRFASPFVGYFLVDNLEGIIRFAYDHTDLSGNGFGSKQDVTSISTGISYNFQNSVNVIPINGNRSHIFS